MDAPDSAAPDACASRGLLTGLIERIGAGDGHAQTEFCRVVYDELRACARRLRRGRGSHTLATTDVVHECLGRLLEAGRLGGMKNRRYFYAAAADQMKRVLIDHWRRKRTNKAGGHLQRQPLDPWLDDLVDSTAARCGGDLEALDAALDQLKADRPRQYEIIQLRFFAGMAHEHIAETLGVSPDTVKRVWRISRARLGHLLKDT
jgi:RNA polymerase sigma factor (TIGR02999 family)